MKTTLPTLAFAALTLTAALELRSQSYELQGSRFNAGGNPAQSVSYIHVGVLDAVGPGKMSSEHYTLQLRHPRMPGAIQLPDGPQLRIARTENGIRISWPIEARRYVLESASRLSARARWTMAPLIYELDRNEIFVIVPPERAESLYRLRMPGSETK